MTKKKRYCKDCKYCRGIGYDFWCGEGHTEYEVFLGETNCPYYEFHDWSKGTPNRTKNKRFEEQNPENHLNRIYDSKNGKVIFDEDILDLLNDLNDENERLKSEYKVLHTQYQDLKKFVEHNFNEYLTREKLDRQIIKLSDENEQFKKANKELKQQLQKIQDSFEFRRTKNYEEFNQDEIYISDMNTKLCLNDNDLFIEVYIPQANEYHRFRCSVVGRSLSECIKTDN